jgi:hypothetical protein
MKDSDRGGSDLERVGLERVGLEQRGLGIRTRVRARDSVVSKRQVGDA